MRNFLKLALPINCTDTCLLRYLFESHEGGEPYTDCNTVVNILFVILAVLLLLLLFVVVCCCLLFYCLFVWFSIKKNVFFFNFFEKKKKAVFHSSIVHLFSIL